MKIDKLLDEKRAATITLGDLESLRHMLGIRSNTSRWNWGYRNRYCAALRNKLQALEDAGLVRFNGALPGANDGEFMFYWSATLAGAELVGLSKAAIRRLGLHMEVQG